MSSAAQDEYNALFSNNRGDKLTAHPEDLSHPSDSSESSSDKEDTLRTSDGDEEDPSASRTVTTMATTAYHIPHATGFEANTGPKGVIADARSFEKARKRSFRQTLYAFSNGLAGNTFDQRNVPSISREKSSSPDMSTDEAHDEFMSKWRANRMNELQTNGHDPRIRRQSPSKRRYGHMNTVDAVGYLDAVEKVPAETVVVVCIYDDEV